MKTIIVKGPALSRSGYGEQTRFALEALRSRPDVFEVYILNIPWGQTGHVAANTEMMQWIHETMVKTQNYMAANGGKVRFDTSLQVTVPNEFEPMAAQDIGYTAGIETTKIAPHWIDKTNAVVQKLITISAHSKRGLEQTSYNFQHPETGEEITNFKIQCPVEVCGYPVREAAPEALDVEFTTSNNFLVVSQWGIRKNLDNTIRWFVEEFKDDEDAGLILKTNTMADSIMDRTHTSQRLKNLLAEEKSWGVEDRKCKIYLLHGELSEGNLTWLYQHPTMKAFVNIGHGEGWGLPLYEAALNELPLITIPWSGQLDFVCKTNKKGKAVPYIIPVDYTIQPVQPAAVWEGVIQADSMWAFARETSYKRALREALTKQDHYRKRAALLATEIKSNFQPTALYEKFISFIHEDPDEDVAEWLKKIEEISEL